MRTFHREGIVNLRDRKKERTLVALGDAATLLFRERGFDATTIEEIAAAAGVSRRTFFRYFPTKEAAFFAGHHARLQQFRESVDARRAQDGAWLAVVAGLLDIAAFYQEHLDGMRAWHAVLLSAPALQAHDLANDQLWEAAIRDIFVSDGQSTFDASLRAGALMGVVRAMLACWYEDDGRSDLVVLGRRAFAWLDGAGR